MEKAAERAGKVPKVVVTDKLASYLDGIELAFGADSKHKQGSPFEIANNNNLIERFHGSLKSRTNVMRGLKNAKTTQFFTDGWLAFYNYLKPHMSLDKPPAREAKLDYSFKDWGDVIGIKPKPVIRVETVNESTVLASQRLQSRKLSRLGVKPIATMSHGLPKLKRGELFVGRGLVSKRYFKGAKRRRTR